MGGTHFVEFGFQLTHIPLHFLYGGSVGKEKKHLKSIVTVTQYYQLHGEPLRGIEDDWDYET